MSRNHTDAILKAFIYLASGITVAILGTIIGYIFVKGMPGISFDFLTRSYEDVTTYVTVPLDYAGEATGDTYTSQKLGITLQFDEENGIVISNIAEDSPVNDADNTLGESYPLEEGDVLNKIGSMNVKTELKELDTDDSAQVEAFLLAAVNAIDESQDTEIQLKVVRLGGGIIPMLVTTIYMILLCLIISVPIGILSAVYLNEYAKKGKLVMLIHFAIENLAGIPSIIYGLFGAIFFVQICHLQYSILAGALTISIILLPTIITTTEEALKALPKKLRESSLGLGATKLQTISKVVLPNAIPGILAAVLLSIGRIVGESAALLLTAGTVAQIPGALFGNSASGATLTIKAYTLMKEENDLTTACAIGIVLIIIIVLINIASKIIANYFVKAKNG